MRYAGGLVGGSWIARLISDLGGGTFDGAWLISNFNSLNPANTYWNKPYKVWAKPEKEEHAATWSSKSGGAPSCISAAKSCNTWSTTYSSAISSRRHRS